MTVALFRDLVSGGEPAFEKLVESRQQEGVQLEFKTKADVTHGELDREDKKNLGIALSGFSNSMGGLLVWGVEARKNVDQTDCASALRPISQIEKFKGRILSLVGDYMSPKAEDIQIEMVRSAADPNSGYVLVYIGRSERRPHRSEAPGDGRYYKRSGDSFYAMEHFDIEDMFKRQTTPALSLVWDIVQSGSVGHEQQLRVRIALENVGITTARFPFISVEHLETYRIYEGTAGQYGLPRIGGQPHLRGHFSGGANEVIHPGQTLHVFAIELGVTWEPGEPDYVVQARTRPLLAKLVFGCDRLAASHEEIALSPEAIVSKLVPRRRQQ